MARDKEARKTAAVGVMTLLKPKVKVASQSVFYALRSAMGLAHRVAALRKLLSPR